MGALGETQVPILDDLRTNPVVVGSARFRAVRDVLPQDAVLARIAAHQSPT